MIALQTPVSLGHDTKWLEMNGRFDGLSRSTKGHRQCRLRAGCVNLDLTSTQGAVSGPSLRMRIQPRLKPQADLQSALMM